MSSQIAVKGFADKTLFALFCLASYLLSLSYGSTFLLALKLSTTGGSESQAGMVISAAMLSTFVAVVFSGHLTDAMGAPRSIAAAGLVLSLACVGFALIPGYGAALLAAGLLLGLGWGIFYTLGPIVVAMLIEPASRARYFALLSGSMMSGIGTGPLMGRAGVAMGFAVESAFIVAALASLLGMGLFLVLARRIERQDVALATTVCRISMPAVRRVARSGAIFPIVMVGLGAAIFGGLSSFQTSYAALLHLDYSLFFLGFMSAAIGCRLLVAGYVVKRDAYVSSCWLTGLMVVAVLMFRFGVDSAWTYLLAAIVLGVGYGLTYSVINGLAANEAPVGLTAQALVLFSLAYFIGVFGFPLLAGRLIVSSGMPVLLDIILAVSVLNSALAVGRLLWRKVAAALPV